MFVSDVIADEHRCFAAERHFAHERLDRQPLVSSGRRQLDDALAAMHAVLIAQRFLNTVHRPVGQADQVGRATIVKRQRQTFVLEQQFWVS